MKDYLLLLASLVVCLPFWLLLLPLGIYMFWYSKHYKRNWSTIWLNFFGHRIYFQRVLGVCVSPDAITM